MPIKISEEGTLISTSKYELKAIDYTYDDGVYSRTSDITFTSPDYYDFAYSIAGGITPDTNIGGGMTIGGVVLGFTVETYHNPGANTNTFKVGFSLYGGGAEITVTADHNTGEILSYEAFGGAQLIIGAKGEFLGTSIGVSGTAQFGVFVDQDGLYVGADLNVTAGYYFGSVEIDEERKVKVIDFDELSDEEKRCFAAGTMIDMADGSQKSIETIEIGDEVMAYDPAENAGRGGLKPARVTRTMVNQVPHLLDFHGVKVTPGHATLCGDGPNEGNHIPLMDILLADGAVVNREGDLLRAATNLPVGSEGDQFVEVAYLTSKSQKTYFRGRMRAGTITLDAEGKTHRVLDALNREGYRLLPDGLIAKDGETPHPLYWFGELPKPADYVLAKSGLTLAELYSAEGQELDRPAAPASSSKIGAELGAVYAGMSVN